LERLRLVVVTECLIRLKQGSTKKRINVVFIWAKELTPEIIFGPMTQTL
jgi:hypothetical protein